jgi:hypothetical protein
VLTENVYYATEGLDKMTKFIESKQAKGMEEGSIIADPMFLNEPDLLTALKPTDFELHPDSPALKLGVEKIDGSQIGLTADYPQHLRALVEPSSQGQWISRNAKVSTSSANSKVSQDPQLLVSEDQELSTVFVHESAAEPTPHVDLDLGKSHTINALSIIASAKDRQNALRALTVWTSEDGEHWDEFWRVDPYHVAMGRDWRVIPGKSAVGRYVRVGLRDRNQLQMAPEDERMHSIRKGLLTLKSIKVFGE